MHSPTCWQWGEGWLFWPYHFSFLYQRILKCTHLSSVITSYVDICSSYMSHQYTSIIKHLLSTTTTALFTDLYQDSGCMEIMLVSVLQSCVRVTIYCMIIVTTTTFPVKIHLTLVQWATLLFFLCVTHNVKKKKKRNSLFPEVKQVNVNFSVYFFKEL